MITHIASVSVSVPLNAVNGLNRLTRLVKGAGTANSIRKFSNRPVAFESFDYYTHFTVTIY